MGVNKHFRGAVLERLMNGLARQQMQRYQGAFEDQGSGSINDGYSTEQFLLMQISCSLGLQRALRWAIPSLQCLLHFIHGIYANYSYAS